VVRVDRRTGAEEELLRPAVGGWSPVGGLHSVSPPVPATTPDEIDALLPLPGDTGLLEDGRGELAAALLAEFGATHYPLCHVSSPLWGCYGVWGFEGLMASIAERPDVVQYACERLLVIAQQGVRQAALIGAEGVWIEECLTDQISPADYARLNLPFLGRLVEAIRRHGMQSVYYYCGDPTDRWDLLLECGADALSLEESKKGFTVDVEEVVRQVRGRCAVLGNLDAIGLLAGGTEEQLRAEVARQVEAGRRNGGRFVMSLGSPVTPDTDVERVRRYCDLVHELG
jgi:uroporphyrinogen-III decarboxylase